MIVAVAIMNAVLVSVSILGTKIFVPTFIGRRPYVRHFGSSLNVHKSTLTVRQQNPHCRNPVQNVQAVDGRNHVPNGHVAAAGDYDTVS